MARERRPEFQSEYDLTAAAEYDGLDLTPRLFRLPAAELPKDLAGMHAFLMDRLPDTLCKLDPQATGRPEGIVLRSTARTTIAKARFQHYERTSRLAAKTDKK